MEGAFLDGCGQVVDAAAPLHAVDDLLAEAGHGLAAGAVVHGEEEDDEAAGGQAARVAETLQQYHLGTVAGRRHGCREPGRAAAHDEDVGTGNYRDAGLREGDVVSGHARRLRTSLLFRRRPAG